MAGWLGEAVERRPSFDESFWDKDWPGIVAALPGLSIAAVWTGVPIRTEQDGDWAAVHAVHTAAFETSAEADLVDTLRRQV